MSSRYQPCLSLVSLVSQIQYEYVELLAVRDFADGNGLLRFEPTFLDDDRAADLFSLYPAGECLRNPKCPPAYPIGWQKSTP